MKPILIDFPNEFITERLHIRLPRPDDGKIVYESIKSSLTELKEWMSFARTEQTIEDVEANIRESHAAFLKREDLRLLLFHKETGELIGSSGLHRIDWAVRKFEIGYWIDSRFSGKGYMTEAVRGITEFAFNELEARRVEIRCDVKNVRSRKIAERVDYDLEGILRNEKLSIDGDETRDTCVYATIKN
ncbi:GNAT family N-acetyltransferase [Pseudalkalibacillus hwajinpoensis]|uniref:GNAT family N-acetyltransferase n=1 Tax=Guptibacillus hwajinpoensis TaxID=208199 RepID=UPI00325BF03F